MPFVSADTLGLDIAPGVGAALIAAGVTGLRAIGMTITGRRDRQRVLYGEAYKVAMSWREMLYRVRRRSNADGELVDRFHDLQEQIDYYEGWIASESRWMARSYCRLVAEVKRQTREPIRSAWCEEERRRPSDDYRDDDVHPDLQDARDEFLKDVRHHLSLWWIPKLAVVWRNRDWLRGRGEQAELTAAQQPQVTTGQPQCAEPEAAK